MQGRYRGDIAGFEGRVRSSGCWPLALALTLALTLSLTLTLALAPEPKPSPDLSGTSLRMPPVMAVGIVVSALTSLLGWLGVRG